MSSLSEIVDLEYIINDRSKVIDLCNTKLRKVRGDMGHYKDDQDAAQARVTHHRNNTKHMKKAADHVVLKEFADTRQHLKNAVEALEDATISMQKSKSEEAELLKKIETCQEDITAARARLSTYGRVVPFQVLV